MHKSEYFWGLLKIWVYFSPAAGENLWVFVGSIELFSHVAGWYRGRYMRSGLSISHALTNTYDSYVRSDICLAPYLPVLSAYQFSGKQLQGCFEM